MPELDEGDLLYMPTTLPGLSIGKARELLQQTDRLIRTLPEVERVFGKVGRAETATDPAPLTMIETTIKLKPRDQWRAGHDAGETQSRNSIERVQVPSLNNAWLMPIKTRIDMQSTGINTPVGIKIAGPDLEVIETSRGGRRACVARRLTATRSVYSERTASARYIDIEIDRWALTRYSTTVEEIQEVINTAVGGVERHVDRRGARALPVNLRYPAHVRDSLEKTTGPAHRHRRARRRFQLRDVAAVRVVDGPPVIKSENARLNGGCISPRRPRPGFLYCRSAAGGAGSRSACRRVTR